MRSAIIGMLLLATAAIGQDRPTQFEPMRTNPVLECTVKVKQQLLLPAKDNGALVSLDVELGDSVEKGAVLGQIDDNEAKAAMVVAQAEWDTAKENAERGSDIQIEYALKAASLSKVEYEKLKDLVRTRSATDWDLQRAELEWERAEAQVNVRKLEKKLAGFELNGKAAALEAAEQALARRRLTAPFSGIVVEKYRREGEWVQAGEHVLWLMNFETMLVSGKVDATRWTREDVAGKPVTVEMVLPRVSDPITFTGKITFVSPISDSLNQEFAVEAEVANLPRGDHWLLPHGEKVTMTIHVN